MQQNLFSNRSALRECLLTRQVLYRFAPDSYRRVRFLEIANLRIEIGFRSEPYIYSTFVGPRAPNCTWALDLVEEECLPKKQALMLTRNPLQSCGCMWACSSAGRAPALQESRQNHTSAASGVAYADSRGAINLLNWTEAGPKSMGDPFAMATSESSVLVFESNPPMSEMGS